MAIQRRRLTVVDRTIIELRRRDGWSIRLITRELGRSSGTICDEIRRRGDAAGYLAATAEADAAASHRRSGRQPRLAPDGALFAEIARLLRLGWSPEQISGRRKRMENGMEHPSGLRVSHEAITPRSVPCRAANYGASCSPISAKPSPCGAASRRAPSGAASSAA
jgi:IS30 family transposase